MSFVLISFEVVARTAQPLEVGPQKKACIFAYVLAGIAGYIIIDIPFRQFIFEMGKAERARDSASE